MIDAGFLDLVRLGVLSRNDPTVKSSLTVVDDILERSTPSGVGFYRYGINSTESVDGYGDCYQPSGSNCTTRGAPWPPSDTGTGHLRPVLSGERGEYDLAAGDPSSARSLLRSMQNMQSGQGLEPEQAWEDPNLAAFPLRKPSGRPRRSASPTAGRPVRSPLTWATGPVPAARDRHQRRPQSGDAADRHQPLRDQRDAGLAADHDHLAHAVCERVRRERDRHRNELPGCQDRRRRGRVRGRCGRGRDHDSGLIR